MVKGLSRRVVTVRFQDGGVFEQAIFMVREGADTGSGGGADSILQEACRIARDYSPEQPTRRRSPLWHTLLGGGVVGLIWFATALVQLLQ